jgi:hypothetical protein
VTHRSARVGLTGPRRLRRRAVEPDRHVVDKRHAVDLGQVDVVLRVVVERVEGIVRGRAEIACEVVVASGRKARVRQFATGGDRHGLRLRLVRSGERDGIRPMVAGRAVDLLEVAVLMDFCDVDAPLFGFAQELRVGGLLGPCGRIHDHQRSALDRRFAGLSPSRRRGHRAPRGNSSKTPLRGACHPTIGMKRRPRP